MNRISLYRMAVLVTLIALLELLCATGVIDPLTMPPPHRIVLDLWRMLASGTLNRAIAKTLTNAAIAAALSIIVGIAAGAAIDRMRWMRQALDPVFATYYAVPVFAFYPMFIILFGLSDAPQIIIAFMLGVIAVIVNTLDGLDRVPRVLAKTAKVSGMGSIATALHVTLPYAAPYLLSGAKLAIAYSLIGIIGAEFIMSRGGMGYEISFAYTNFDNATMYPLILLIVIVSTVVNAALARWERMLLTRRGLA